jgi:NitT/TauT family transport system substrate-binding protein
LITTDLTAQLVPNSVMDLAVTLGYFAREGVEVELVRVQQTPSAVAALMAGEGDMANISVDSALQLVARNQMKLKAVLSPNKSLPFLIAAKTAITTVKGLEGKSFGIGRVGSVDQTLSMTVMRKNGTDPEKVQYVGIGQPATRAEALAAGAIDATTMSIGVWMSMPNKTGLHVLVDQPTYFAAAPVIDKVNVVRDDVLMAKRDQVAAVTRAIIAASRDFANNPQLWVNAMVVARPDVSRSDLETLAAAFKYSWSVNGGLNKEELLSTVEATYQGPDYRDLRKVAFEEWVDLSIIEAILKSVGVSPISDKPTS